MSRGFFHARVLGRARGGCSTNSSAYLFVEIELILIVDPKYVNSSTISNWYLLIVILGDVVSCARTFFKADSDSEITIYINENLHTRPIDQICERRFFFHVQ